MKCLPLVSTVLSLTATVAAAGPASGTFKADKNGAIAPKYAAGYTVRDSRHAHASGWNYPHRRAGRYVGSHS
jgi:hypothetical protein